MSEELSRRVCLRPIRGANVGSYGPRVVWPNGDIWAIGARSASDQRSGYVSLRPDSDTFEELTGFTSTRLDNTSIHNLTVLPWRNELLGVVGFTPAQLVVVSRDGRRRPLRQLPYRGSSNNYDYEVITAAPELALAVLKIGGDLFAFAGSSDELRKIPLEPGFSFVRAAAAGKNILLAGSRVLERPSGYFGDDAYELALFTLDRTGRASRVHIPDGSRIAMDVGLCPWPSRNSVLVVSSAGALVQNGPNLKSLAVVSPAGPHLHNTGCWYEASLEDCGPDRAGIIGSRPNLWSADSSTGMCHLWTRPDGIWPQYFAWAIDPLGNGLLVATPDGLARVDDSGVASPIDGATTKVVGAIQEIRSAPFLRAAFIKTGQLWRVLDEDGVLRQIDGLEALPVKDIQIFETARRALVFGGNRALFGGDDVSEIVVRQG